MTKRREIVGTIFGRLTVLEIVGWVKEKGLLCTCICSCGNLMTARAGNLRSGNTKSCGCMKVEKFMSRIKKHGMAFHPLYPRYRGMMERCYNPKSKEFRNYGGRGIDVCDRWRNSVDSFIEDMGPPPSESHSLDRIDNNSGYSPENCRWASKKEQTINRRCVVLVEMDGKTMCLADWGRYLGMGKSAIAARIRNGWSIEMALTTPKIAKGCYGRKPKANPGGIL